MMLSKAGNDNGISNEANGGFRRPLNILLYSHSFLPKIGGREIVVYQLALALRKLGHQVRVVGPAWTRNTKTEKYPFVVHRYPRFAQRLAASSAVKQLYGQMEMLISLLIDLVIWPCDVIHAHSLYPAGYVASFLKRLFTNVSLVMTPHGVDINTDSESGYGMRLDPKLRRKIDLALEKADAVTAISSGVRKSLSSAGVVTEKLYSIGNGIDPERFKREGRIDVFSRMGILSDRKIILTVGNYSPLKGQADLIRAMPAILDSQPRACLVIVGSGTEVLWPLIESAGVHGAVVLTGAILPPTEASDGIESEDLLAEIYLSSELYVSASNAEGGEGLSLALLDGIAAGLAVVATDITGNRDVVIPGKNGYLVTPGNESALADAIIDGLSDDRARIRMGKESKEIAKLYSWTAVARQYVELYRCICSRGPVRQES